MRICFLWVLLERMTLGGSFDAGKDAPLKVSGSAAVGGKPVLNQLTADGVEASQWKELTPIDEERRRDLAFQPVLPRAAPVAGVPGRPRTVARCGAGKIPVSA